MILGIFYYSLNQGGFFLFRGRAIKYSTYPLIYIPSQAQGFFAQNIVNNYGVHKFEDTHLMEDGENEYFSLTDTGRKPQCSLDKADKIAFLANAREW